MLSKIVVIKEIYLGVDYIVVETSDGSKFYFDSANEAKQFNKGDSVKAIFNTDAAGNFTPWSIEKVEKGVKDESDIIYHTSE